MSFYFWVDFTILLITLTAALYFYSTRKFNHWKKKKVPFIPPVPLFGSAFDVFTLRQNIGDFTRKIYESTVQPYVGFFICDEPYLLVRDPELVKNILVKDFDVFSNRSVFENKKDDPMGAHILFLLKTPDWRNMRRKLSPAFSSGKMKNMYPLMGVSGKEMVEYLVEQSKSNPVIDSREVAAKYTTDVISSTSFGINANSFKYEDSEFRAVSRRVFNWAIWERAISTSFHFVAPSLVKLFKMRFVDKASSDFLREVFWRMMNERQEKKFVRNDLLDILIELKKQENIDDPYKLEGDKLVAQATQFFIAGFETSSSTISFTLYELAVNKDFQNKAREEIKEVIKKHGDISYDSLKDMQYVDWCIKETLRKYPVLPFLDRRSSADYQIPGTDVVLEKGSPIFVSVMGMHYDPKYFPDPDKYDPTRHSEENVKTRPSFTYLPFGEGPRNCIGARFGAVSSKSGVAHILNNFEVELCEETQHPLKIDPRGFLVAPISGLLLKFNRM